MFQRRQLDIELREVLGLESTARPTEVRSGSDGGADAEAKQSNCQGAVRLGDLSAGHQVSRLKLSPERTSNWQGSTPESHRYSTTHSFAQEFHQKRQFQIFFKAQFRGTVSRESVPAVWPRPRARHSRCPPPRQSPAAVATSTICFAPVADFHLASRPRR